MGPRIGRSGPSPPLPPAGAPGGVGASDYRSPAAAGHGGPRAPEPGHGLGARGPHQCVARRGGALRAQLTPTVSLGVTYVAACTYGCDNGRISPTRCAIIAAGLDGR